MLFGNKLVEVGGSALHILTNKTSEAVTKAVLDNYLLGECDEVIYTAGKL